MGGRILAPRHQTRIWDHGDDFIGPRKRPWTIVERQRSLCAEGDGRNTRRLTAVSLITTSDAFAQAPSLHIGVGTYGDGHDAIKPKGPEIQRGLSIARGVTSLNRNAKPPG